MRDDIAVVEAAYRLEARDDVWLRGILEACAPILFDGLGGFGTIYRRDAPTPQQMVSPYVMAGADQRITDALRVAFEATDDATRRLAFTIGRPVATLTDLHGVAPLRNPAYRDLAHLVGFGDVVTVNAANPDGTGCFLSAPLRRSARSPAASRWARLAAHVAAGLRLRRTLQPGGARQAAEAVLSAGGEVLHATTGAAGAREGLRTAVRRIDRARASLRRRNLGDALDVWTALVEGRWSLVDCFESDGRRFVLAVPNAPTALDPRALTPEERVVAAFLARGHSNKLIAYTLGVPPGTVATRTAAVLRKLGARSRAAFVDRYLAIVAADYQLVGDGSVMLGASPVTGEGWGAGLTPAEQEVAVLAAKGLTNGAIGRQRGTSPRTVANQLARVFAALGVRSRTELALVARRHAARPAHGPTGQGQ